MKDPEFLTVVCFVVLADVFYDFYNPSLVDQGHFQGSLFLPDVCEECPPFEYFLKGVLNSKQWLVQLFKLQNEPIKETHP